MAYVDPQIIDMQGDGFGEGEERRLQFDVAPLDVLPDRGRERRAEGESSPPCPFVPDHRRRGEQVVAEGVVAMVMGVHERPDRQITNSRDGCQVVTGTAFRGAGVDAGHAAPADEESGVVDPPASVRLHMAVHTVTDLYHARGRQVLM